MTRYVVVLVALVVAGCGNEKGLAELDVTRLILSVQPSVAGALNVTVRIEWRSDGGCTSLAEDVRVTLDDSAIDASTYLGGDNDKAHGCNDWASFTRSTFVPSDTGPAVLRVVDATGALTMTVASPLAVRAATLREPADGSATLGDTVVIDLSPATDGVTVPPPGLEPFSVDFARVGDIYAVLRVDGAALSIEDGALTFALPLELEANSAEPGEVVGGVIRGAGTLAPRIDDCSAASCLAAVRVKLEVPLELHVP